MKRMNHRHYISVLILSLLILWSVFVCRDSYIRLFYSVVNAMYAAVRDARETRDDNVPPYLKDNSMASAEDKAQSRNYKYPHDYGGYVEQQYLPDSLKDKIYYHPTDNGFEKEVQEIRRKKGKKN